jgi:hypothetical protein
MELKNARAKANRDFTNVLKSKSSAALDAVRVEVTNA